MAAKDTLTRDKHTIAERHIKTADGKHTLYVQEWGNKAGTPILFLHGGPGTGCHDSGKLLFNPEKHYVIFLDQRGSGRSAPFASMEANTTQLLIKDIEQVREEFKIEKFVIHGRSWGATLALCYAIGHPQHVTHIVTGGIFLGTQKEEEWILKGGFSTFFPEIWGAYGNDPDTILRYARLSGPLVKLDDRSSKIEENEFDENVIKLNYEYGKYAWFLPDNYIIDNAHKITMPVTIIQGRYDMLTPPKAAYALYKALPTSTLQWTLAGHSKTDRGNFDATKAALSQL